MKRQFKILTISFILTGTFLFSGCAIVGSMVIAKNATCNVKINNKYIKGSCNLFNGVFIERLTIINTDSTGMPSEYVVTERFACHNPGTEGHEEYWPTKLCFRKPNGHYTWKADTVDIHYKLNGRKREIVSMQKKTYNYNEMFILNSQHYETCPIRFQKNTWYNIRIYDQRVTKVLLFVDNKRKFNVYKFDSGICPI